MDRRSETPDAASATIGDDPPARSQAEGLRLLTLVMDSPARPFSAIAVALAAFAALLAAITVEMSAVGSAASRLGWSALLSSSMSTLLIPAFRHWREIL